MRLDKFLSNNGFGSRKDVKVLIKKKHVLVNEVVATKPEDNIDPLKDVVKVNGEVVSYKEFYYFLLNKSLNPFLYFLFAVHSHYREYHFSDSHFE